MIALADVGLEPAVLDQLRGFAAGLPGDAGAFAEAAARARAAERHWDFMAPARAIDAFLAEAAPPAEGQGAPGLGARRAAVAALVLDHFQVTEPLTPSMRAAIPAWFRNLATFLRRTRGYDDDAFAKDVRYALGLTVPCGAMQVDLFARVGPKLMLRPALRGQGAGDLARYLAARGWGRWYQDHLDLRYMRDFSPAGWTAFFVEMAHLLELNPQARGVIGASWYYDPKVPEISPELAYVRLPLSHGAFSAPLDAAPHHVRNAMALSETRRRLIEEGRYQPRGYLMAWPRRPLMAWARRVRSDPSVGFEAT